MSMKSSIVAFLLCVTPSVAPPVQRFSETECTAWAGEGECVANPAFMIRNCKVACQKHEMARRAYNKRCPVPSNHTPALKPGDMPQTFSRIMSDFPELEPEMLSQDPPVVLFNNFMSDDETKTFMMHGEGHYARSKALEMDSEGHLQEVETPHRTSSHAWCQDENCLSDPVVKRVSARVANVTRTPEDNAEYVMILYYHACNNPGDPSCAYFRQHTDYIASDRERLQGVRIYTLFAFLNDVHDGGATSFTNLPSNAVSVQARKGKAILWPSVLANDPNTVDLRTQHEALPVTKGEKFGAMFWIHQHNFKESMRKGCTVD